MLNIELDLNSDTFFCILTLVLITTNCIIIIMMIRSILTTNDIPQPRGQYRLQYCRFDISAWFILQTTTGLKQHIIKKGDLEAF